MGENRQECLFYKTATAACAENRQERRGARCIVPLPGTVMAWERGGAAAWGGEQTGVSVLQNCNGAHAQRTDRSVCSTKLFHKTATGYNR